MLLGLPEMFGATPSSVPILSKMTGGRQILKALKDYPAFVCRLYVEEVWIWARAWWRE